MARILIIDDDAPIRALLRKILEQDGHTILDASNGKIGIALYRAEPTDLIITDIVMPEKDGLETVMELRHDFPEIKILAMSGGGRDGGTHYLTSAKAFGAVHTLSKPFTPQKVLEVVQTLLQQKDT